MSPEDKPYTMQEFFGVSSTDDLTQQQLSSYNAYVDAYYSGESTSPGTGEEIDEYLEDLPVDDRVATIQLSEEMLDIYEGNDAIGEPEGIPEEDRGWIGSDTYSPPPAAGSQTATEAVASEGFQDSTVVEDPDIYGESGDPTTPSETWTSSTASTVEEMERIQQALGGRETEDDPDGKKPLSPWDGKLSRSWKAGPENTSMKESVPDYRDAPCEKVYKGDNNTWIILGRDRNMGFSSGYGGRGHTRSGAIDLVVGLQGWGPEHKQAVDKNFGSMGNERPGDAARIYISQRANIDQYFDICEGSMGNSWAKSAIGIKADEVRIMARRGRKRVTGQSPQQRTSLNGKIEGQFGIDLIAGNRDDVPSVGRSEGAVEAALALSVPTDQPYLQPIPKGLNLRDCLTDMTEQIISLNTLVTDFVARQMIINSSIAGSPVSGFAGPLPVISMTTALPMVSKEVVQQVANIFSRLMKQQMKLNLSRVNYLTPVGALYINSRYNRTN